MCCRIRKIPIEDFHWRYLSRIQNDNYKLESQVAFLLCYFCLTQKQVKHKWIFFILSSSAQIPWQHLVHLAKFNLQIACDTETSQSLYLLLSTVMRMWTTGNTFITYFLNRKSQTFKFSFLQPCYSNSQENSTDICVYVCYDKGRLRSSLTLTSTSNKYSTTLT